MFIKAAINGGRASTSLVAVPGTPFEIAEEARAAVLAGANVIHAHARNEAGRETIAPTPVEQMMRAVRDCDSSITLGTTTGLWTCRDHLERMNHVEAWTTLPDFASVAFREEGADEVARLLVDRGIKIESAIWSLSDIPALLASSVLDKNIRLLIEPDDKSPDEAVRTCRQALEQLSTAGVVCPILYHGEDATVWPVVHAALADGVQVRVGFEDGLHLPDGSVASSNAELIRAVYDLHCVVRGDAVPLP